MDAAELVKANTGVLPVGTVDGEDSSFSFETPEDGVNAGRDALGSSFFVVNAMALPETRSIRTKVCIALIVLVLTKCIVCHSAMGFRLANNSGGACCSIYIYLFSMHYIGYLVVLSGDVER